MLKEYTAIILPVFCVGVKLGHHVWGTTLMEGVREYFGK
jgi:hypothetical protein